jgi:hypothetical protein
MMSIEEIARMAAIEKLGEVEEYQKISKNGLGEFVES